ncbi:hypothetical protein B835_1772 [Enterococcus mundtii 3F]|nr:hypothetical protein [Enterococcus mundtii 3F]
MFFPENEVAVFHEHSFQKTNKNLKIQEYFQVFAYYIWAKHFYQITYRQIGSH